MSGQKNKTIKKTEFAFKLTSKTNLWHKNRVNISYAPITDKCKQQKSVTPTYNNDRMEHTPAFVIPSEMESTSADQLKEEHQKRVRYAQMEMTQIFVPKPTSKHCFCAVCHAQYEDYLEHIESQTHLDKTRRSPYQHMIVDMIGQINKKREKEELAWQKIYEQQLFNCLKLGISDDTDSRKQQEFQQL